ELKEKLFKSSVPFRALTDDDLADISGGISGRQALSACMGLMILTGVGTDMLGINSYAGAKGTETSVTSVVSKQSFGDKVRKKLSQLAEKLGIKTGSKEIKPKSAKELKKEEHEKLLRFADILTNDWVAIYAELLVNERVKETEKQGKSVYSAVDWKLYAFSIIEHYKYEADYYNFDYGVDVTEYKAKLDKLMNETNFENFNKKDFNEKVGGLADSFYKSVGVTLKDQEYIDMINATNLSKKEQSNITKSLYKKICALDEQLGISWNDEADAKFHHMGGCAVICGWHFGK
ncbi:MAG: hypothetical protein Q4D57_02165, partial [Clostridia bacterium]|nr:hypothetical protein [Clostridia bacterium]